jgi:hypothetical protein
MRNDYLFLLEFIQQLTPSDLSILQASLDTPGSQIATVEGTPNDAFWMKLGDQCGQ